MTDAGVPETAITRMERRLRTGLDVTVNAVRQLERKGAAFCTVHGDEAILRAAVAERKTTKILAVTVLTSLATRVVVHTLLAQNVEGLVDFSVGDLGLGTGQFRAGQIAQLDFRIHLEGGIECDLVVGHAFGLQLEARLAGNLHALLIGEIGRASCRERV